MLEEMLLAIISFIITLLLTPKIGKRLKETGIVGEDLHKEDRPEIPEMGGIAVLVGFSVPVIAAYTIFQEPEILAGLILVLLVGIIGVVDGLKRLSPEQKVISFSIVGLLLIPFSSSTMLGHKLGIVYFISLPVGFMIACNFTNMLAGFNGLEIGTGAIATTAVLALSILNSFGAGIVISSCMLSALLAFLYYNIYPARIFPGDVGTTIIGAVMFAVIVLGNFELIGFIIFIPYAIDAALKYLSAGIMTKESQTPTIVKEGRLYAPEGGNLSLPRIFLRRQVMNEREVVYCVWVIEALFGIFAVLVEVLR